MVRVVLSRLHNLITLSLGLFYNRNNFNEAFNTILSPCSSAYQGSTLSPLFPYKPPYPPLLTGTPSAELHALSVQWTSIPLLSQTAYPTAYPLQDHVTTSAHSVSGIAAASQHPQPQEGLLHQAHAATAAAYPTHDVEKENIDPRLSDPHHSEAVNCRTQAETPRKVLHSGSKMKKAKEPRTARKQRSRRKPETRGGPTLACNYPDCEREFSSQIALVRHEGTVHGATRFYCPFWACYKNITTLKVPAGFNRLDSFKRHFSRSGKFPKGRHVQECRAAYASLGKNPYNCRRQPPAPSQGLATFA